jgi:hypothetical protein
MELRTALVYRGLDAWEQTAFDDLKRFQIFKLVEPDGDPVDGGEVCIATTDAFNGSIECEPLDQITPGHWLAPYINVYGPDNLQMGFVQRIDMNAKTVDVLGPNPGTYPFKWVHVRNPVGG